MVEVRACLLLLAVSPAWMVLAIQLEIVLPSRASCTCTLSVFLTHGLFSS